jgi:parallel beta-helix repeat protein
MTDNGDGIYLDYSSNNTISGNNITSNIKGYGGGIALDDSSNNTISENNMANNSDGVYLYNSSYNTISKNKLTSNKYAGIVLFDSSNNSIIENNITNNWYGIDLYESSGNIIYHNNFEDNIQHVYDRPKGWPGFFPSMNTWDDGYPSGGNYWSDYEERYPNATEIDDSGIWDTPYVIDENNQDNYPIMNPWTPSPPIPPPPPTITTVDVNPDTLNLKSKGRWITVHIELPEGYNVSNIDRSTILLNDTIPVDSFWLDKPLESVIGDYDNDGITDLMVKFDRQALTKYLKTKGTTDDQVTLVITGEANGKSFEVTDTIKVIDP